MAHHLVSARVPDHDAGARMLNSISITVTGPTSLIATSGMAPLVEPVPPLAAAKGIIFDPLGSAGLQPGIAIMATLGRRIGRVTVQPRRTSGSPVGEAIPIRVAAAVLALVIERHYARMDGPAMASGQGRRPA